MRHTLLPSTLIGDFRNTHISPRFLQRIDFQKTDFGAEFGAEPGFVDSAVQLVDLFEGEAFGFVDEEPDECDADEAETGCFWLVFLALCRWDWFGGGVFCLGCLPAPDEEDFGLEICVFFVDHVWCRIRLDARD